MCLLIRHTVDHNVDCGGGKKEAMCTVEHGLAPKVPHVTNDFFFLLRNSGHE